MKKTLLLSFIMITAFIGVCHGRISHPSLLFTKERVAEAKGKISRDSAYSKAWGEIREQADKLLKAGNPIDKTEYLALAYMMTGDRIYSDKIIEILKKAASAKSFGNSEMMARKPSWRSELKLGWNAQQAAIGYDVVYDQMSPSERTQIAESLYRLMVEPLLGDWLLEPTRIHSLNSMGHNWWTACVSGGSMLALAISNEVPAAETAAREAIESLPEWFGFAGDVLQNKPKTFDDEGGMYESVNYANFGIMQALLMRLAWKNSHPGEKLEEIPAIDLIPEFFCNVAYPRNGELYSINFGDSHKNVTGEGPVVLSYTLGAKTPDALWYISQIDPYQFREGMPLRFPMGFLYAPDLSKAPAAPSLPLSHLWKDFGWATMRDSWRKDASMLAVKSGMTWNHSHADANSFIVFHNGVDIIKDAGNCSYGKPEYRGYFFQTDAHNVVKFNGQGQPTHQQYHGTMLPGSVSGLVDGGNIKYVLADGTGPMSRWFSRNFRHFLWIDNVIFIIDDIEAHEAGHFEWLWHPGGKAEKKGFDLNITNGNSAAVLRPIYPRPLAYSNFVHDYPEDLYWEIKKGPTENLQEEEEYYSFHLPATTDRVKGVTAVILKDSVGQKELPVIERREGQNWIGMRMTYKGKVTDIYINQLADGRLMHMNSWINADGMDTDAYIVAISYDEKKGRKNFDECFIGYGSALRDGGDVLFSSLAKLNVIAKAGGRKLDLHADGQPRLNFKFKGNPARVTLNGKDIPVKKSGNLVSVKSVR